MPKVTIVIPVLNVRPYIKECLDSVVNQTLSDIEIFCIDAGSTDGTLEIEKEYAARDSRVTILDDDAHSTGYAKNLGISRASSPYVAIVESDDYIAPDMMEKLYQTAAAYDLDMVKANYRSFLGEGDARLFVDKSISLDGEDYEKVIDPRSDNRFFGWDMYTWTGLYKKKFLEQYHILHQESGGAAFQDVGFWFQTFCYARRVYLMKEFFYCYRRDNPNASVKNPSRTFIMCGEYRFVRDIVSKDRQTWERVKPAYYHEMFRSYFVTCERLAPHLRPAFADRFYQEIREGYEAGCIQRELFDEYELAYLDILLSSKENFVRKLTNQKQETEEKQKALFQKISESLHCIIFSAGSHGANLQVMLKQKFQMDIRAFCDNDEHKQGRTINHVKVLSLWEAEKSFPNAVYLIANKKYSRQIQNQLSELGIGADRVIDCKVEELIDGFL
jgi:glycosyltransferase involved in cell wall biosynthesis